MEAIVNLWARFLLGLCLVMFAGNMIGCGNSTPAPNPTPTPADPPEDPTADPSTDASAAANQ